jgi:hypothetical protein
VSRKHNTAHPDRGRSHYRDRLTKRGLSKSPRLEDLNTLEWRQERRTIATCYRDHVHNLTDCTGQPWWAGPAEVTQEDPAEALLRNIFTAEEFNAVVDGSDLA